MDWLATLKDFGFPVTMAVGLLILLTKNLEEVKNVLNDAVSKLVTNQTLILSMSTRLNEVTDIIAKNQVAIANSLSDSQSEIASKLIAYQADISNKLIANQTDVANKLMTIQTILMDKK